MKSSVFLLAAFALALAFASCGPDGTNTGVCDPACAEGTTCKAGICVEVSSGDEADAGDIIIGPKKDGGVSSGSKDGGTAGGTDAGLQACAAQTTKAQQLPLDIYIMLDQSGSMDEATSSGTRWTAVTSALKSFLAQPMTGVSAGIQYFGLPINKNPTSCKVQKCNTDSDCGSGCGPCEYNYCGKFYSYSEESCVASDYAKPDVEISLLPGAVSALNASIDAHNPETMTPTSAALQGAVNHAKEWAQSHPGRVVIVILATDGVPTVCNTSMTYINNIAAGAAAGNPKILTYVIGVGSSLTNLNGIAAAGGTGKAFLVDTAANVNQQFLDAMNSIRGAALACSYTIPTPSSGTPDFNKVNVQYKPGNGGAEQILPKVASKVQCPTNSAAWYYDNPNAPTQIILCDYACNTVKADTSGEVNILLGCQTIIN